MADDNVRAALYAESAERYKDMSKFMTDRVYCGTPLNAEERDLLSAAFKGALNSLRHAVRVARAVEESESGDRKRWAQEYRAKVLAKLTEHCTMVTNLLSQWLVERASGEAKVFYLKMKGDYHRYLAESLLPQDKTREVQRKAAHESYYIGQTAANHVLPVGHPIRLGLALNFSVFYHELYNATGEAALLAKKAHDDAVNYGGALSEDSMCTLQLLRDNLDLWSVGDPVVNVGAHLGVTIEEFDAIMKALTFDYKGGFAHKELQKLTKKDVDHWVRQPIQPADGYHLASGIKSFMGKDVHVNATVQLPGRRKPVVLKSGDHKDKSLLQACEVTGAADVFFSHWQGELVKDTREGALGYVMRNCGGNKSIRFWLDFTSLNQNEVTWSLFRSLTKAMIARPPRLVLMMSPWVEPETLKRMWCCLEVGLHVKAGHEVAMTMTASDATSLRQSFIDSDHAYNQFGQMVQNLDIKKAKARLIDDERWVRSEISDSDGNFDSANEELRESVSHMFSLLTQGMEDNPHVGRMAYLME